MFDPTNDLSQQQPSSIADVTDSAFLANQILDQVCQFLTYTDANFNNDIEPTINDDEWNALVDELFTKNQFPEVMLNSNEIQIQNLIPQNSKINAFISSQNFIQMNNLSPEPKTIDNAILVESVLPVYQSNKNSLISKNKKVNQNQSISVTPITYISDPNTNMACNTTKMQNDILKSNKIQIRSQPRSKYRPRTQTESKNSSHYLRCEDDVELDYPAIFVPKIWAIQSDMNIIEVALMDIEKQPHPYVIDNKISKNAFDDEGLIWRQNELNVLYFRLTNDDFLKGFKTFMIELIKSKQDDVITKKLIRMRRLDQSMLRFTRIYRDNHGKYQRDIGSEEYSCIMTENYGDVTVEHVGPRYGPMSGQEMIFLSVKGRFVKEDLSVIISEQTTNWSQEIKKFMLNGSFIYFSMPTFPHPQMNRVNASVNIYFKKEKILESTYLYTKLLDQELAVSNSDIDISMILNNVNHLQFDMLASSCPASLISQKTSKNKSQKRLNSR